MEEDVVDAHGVACTRVGAVYRLVAVYTGEAGDTDVEGD